MGVTLYACCHCDWYGTEPDTLQLVRGEQLACPRCAGQVKGMYEDEPTTLWECPKCKWHGSDPELAIYFLYLPNERISNECPRCKTEVRAVRCYDSEE